VVTVYALWDGGTNYVSSGEEDSTYLEEFKSVGEAVDALVDRARMGHHFPQTFRFADGREEHSLTPCADSGAGIRIWLNDPRGIGWTAPDVSYELDDYTLEAVVVTG
jgi:hypothetical protein